MDKRANRPQIIIFIEYLEELDLLVYIKEKKKNR